MHKWRWINHFICACSLFFSFPLLVLAVRKKNYVCGTGGGPATQDYTPAEDLALSLNKGRPAVEGIPGGTSTDALLDEESAPLIAGRSILFWSVLHI